MVRLGPRPLDMDLKEQIDVLRMMDDEYRVFGKSDGRGVAKGSFAGRRTMSDGPRNQTR